jgi:hypothetical protein
LLDDLPDPFLTSLFDRVVDGDPITLCADFDDGEWRCEQLAKHLTEWILEFSLRSSERAMIRPGKMVAAVRDAASRIFEKDSISRGEAGEILLHAACRQEFQTNQLIARLYYKSSLDEQIHGFDCVHFRQDDTGDIELWLGESKLYASAKGAITEARKSIKAHLDRGFIKSQKTILFPKITDESSNSDFTAQISQLFHKNTPIDKFLHSMVVPVLIACDSSAVNSATETCSQYLSSVYKEMVYISDHVRKGSPFSEIRIQPIYVPLKSKEKFRKSFGTAITRMQ